MSIERHNIDICGIPVEVVRKDIKNLHLGVYPPNGRVRVAAPLSMNDSAIRLAVICKLGWIKRQRAGFAVQPRESRREMVSGESHYYLGKRYRLRVFTGACAIKVVMRGRSFIELHVPSNLTPHQRELALQRWYRRQMRQLLPPLVAKWQAKIGVKVAELGIKKMKTRWGTCSIEARRIWLNLELVKKPLQCLEYLLVHEMIHLLERHHNERFRTLMDRFLPNWEFDRNVLNGTPLAHEEWHY